MFSSSKKRVEHSAGISLSISLISEELRRVKKGVLSADSQYAPVVGLIAAEASRAGSDFSTISSRVLNAKLFRSDIRYLQSLLDTQRPNENQYVILEEEPRPCIIPPPPTLFCGSWQENSYVGACDSRSTLIGQSPSNGVSGSLVNCNGSYLTDPSGILVTFPPPSFDLSYWADNYDTLVRSAYFNSYPLLYVDPLRWADATRLAHHLFLHRLVMSSARATSQLASHTWSFVDSEIFLLVVLLLAPRPGPQARNRDRTRILEICFVGMWRRGNEAENSSLYVAIRRCQLHLRVFVKGSDKTYSAARSVFVN